MAEFEPFDSDVGEQSFRLLVNSVTDYAICMLDPEGHVATWNPGARRFRGYEEHEAVGMHCSAFFTPEDREARLPWRALETAAREGRFESEGWRVRKDGTRFWTHAVVEPVRGAGGRLLGFVEIARDIGDRKDRERALYESEQRFRMLVQGVRDYAIYMLDRNGYVTNWNTGAASIKGYSEEEIVGRHFSRFYTEEDRANGEPQRALETALREGKYEKEAWRVRKDGTRFWASVLLDPIYDERGELAGFAKITRDVTERRRAQEELEETRAALFQAQKLQALGELTGGIAHDFNNLMTVIRGSADLLRREGLSEEKRRRYLDAIVDTADRASTLTSHLLAFGRRQALKPEVIDLNLRLDAFGEVLGRTLGGGVEVKLDLAPGLWPVEVDTAQLETALLNAAFNARDAMPEGGRITLSTANVDSTEGGEVCIGIGDTGQGMSEEVLARAFEPFYTTKPVGKGTGLGLSQIHGFAAQSGGRAEIASKPGEGTTIRLFLPRSEKAAGEAQEAPEPRAARSAATLLVVEDNDQVREFALSLLEEMGYRVVPAASAEEALQILDRGEEAIDLIFSDVVMPGLSGVDLAHAAREKQARLPILLASGYSEEIVAGAGASFDFVRKPYHAGALDRAIQAALKQAEPVRV